MVHHFSWFERASIALVLLCLMGVGGAMILHPSTGVTTAPKAILDLSARTHAEILASEFDGLTTAAGHPDFSDTERRPSVRLLEGTFARMGYSLDAVKSGGIGVPRLLLASIPGDMDELAEPKDRKALFLSSVLPLVLEVNDSIRADRVRLENIRNLVQDHQRVPALERLWLTTIAERYGRPETDFKGLLSRMDVVPPSLALAQAAVESGWGTSRFARDGNALFGQWTMARSDKGLVPQGRDKGKTHRIKAFDRLIDSVAGYMHNLNTHRAYGDFRRQRSTQRRTGGALSGHDLAGTLGKYSERGQHYIDTLRRVIDANDLRRLDDAQLRGPVVTALLTRGS
ncbi:glucosaminidase domain-containing protein [Magnetospira sp. QH-2]|uniref:glucosaminidase domain-containing protein n=1 Tax=Magnetospira sp. (strain QH-2) TaxID=1288970 RepID=UPI0003E818C3|nr:glucosaminidase domain-containing protein [Magnetospira sp. QH-2]CCQ75698.1 putative GH73 : distantly related to peptidoglycan hydrolases [Magnetospira sp. QH-2]